MDIKSFGCSFIYGSELLDQFEVIPSKNTWPALVAKQLGTNYQCFAKPAIGNLQIAEQVLNHITEPALYIIGWTWIDRFDYTDSKNDQWRTVLPSDSDSLARNYYKDLHSQYRDKLTNLMYIKLIIDTLKEKNYPFIMTSMDDLIFETEWHCSPSILSLQNSIKPHITWFNGQTFLNWSKQNGYPIGVNLHPLELAHKKAAEYILGLGVSKI